MESAAGRAGRRLSRFAAAAAASMLLCLVVGASQVRGETLSETFTYTGGEQSFEVPAGVSAVNVVLVGGHGGSSSRPGGRGALVRGALKVVPGQILYVEVGGNGPSNGIYGSGGFNGGGEGAGGGAGASDLRTSPRASGLFPEPRLVVAGGGGGGGRTGGCEAGAGGAAEQRGEDSRCPNTGGGAGGPSGGGSPGSGGCADGSPGTLGQGGNAGICNWNGGGGGGGLYGGGGGGSASSNGGGGGGGGSSLVPVGGSTELTEQEPEVEITFEQGPNATTEPATEVTYNTATLNGSVDTDGFPSDSCVFEYGETTAYGRATECHPKEIESEVPKHVSAKIHGLSARTAYHYRVVLSAAERTVYGADEEFETGPEPPVVSAVSPAAGFEAGGNTVEITGSRLAEATAVYFGFSPASFTVNSDRSITATAPSQPRGRVHVTVSNPGGSSASSQGDGYTYVAHDHAPTITRLSVKKGPASGGTQVTITGTTFVGVTDVRFGDAAASYTVEDPETVVADAPPGSTGKVEITVTTPNGESGITRKALYTYGRPTITGVNPGGQPLTVTSAVTISGSGFQPGSGTVFKFGKTQATNVSCGSTTSCTATAPASSAPGPVDVAAVSAGKKSPRSAADRFVYEGPQITSIQSDAGPRQGGSPVAIHGAGFAPGKSNTTFAFGKALAILVECPTFTECTMLTPAVSSTGPVDVLATVAKTRSPANPATDQYTFE
jgi:hypothetical protein